MMERQVLDDARGLEDDYTVIVQHRELAERPEPFHGLEMLRRFRPKRLHFERSRVLIESDKGFLTVG